MMNEEDVPFDDLRRAPAVAALLDRFDFIRSLTAEQRRLRLNIQSANLRLAGALQRGTLDSTMISELDGMIANERSVLDPELLLSVHSQLGVAHAQLQEWDAAIPQFAAARELAGQAGDAAQEGLFLRDLADCFRATGKPSEAIASYLEALPLLR